MDFLACRSCLFARVVHGCTDLRCEKKGEALTPHVPGPHMLTPAPDQKVAEAMAVIRKALDAAPATPESRALEKAIAEGIATRPAPLPTDLDAFRTMLQHASVDCEEVAIWGESVGSGQRRTGTAVSLVSSRNPLVVFGSKFTFDSNGGLINIDGQGNDGHWDRR